MTSNFERFSTRWKCLPAPIDSAPRFCNCHPGSDPKESTFLRRSWRDCRASFLMRSKSGIRSFLRPAPRSHDWTNCWPIESWIGLRDCKGGKEHDLFQRPDMPPDVQRARGELTEWAPIVANWLKQGLQPYFFTHAPADQFAPTLASMFHEALMGELPSLPPLPEWPGEQETHEPRQQELF